MPNVALFDSEFQSTLSVRRATWEVSGYPSSDVFQSTLSVRRATGMYSSYQQQPHISIHALREESDSAQHGQDPNRIISIHALREESDLYCNVTSGPLLPFQSTLSVRRATRRDGGRTS